MGQQERAALEEQRDTLASKYQKLKSHVMQLQNLNNNFAAEEGFVGEPLMASHQPFKVSPRATTNSSYGGGSSSYAGGSTQPPPSGRYSPAGGGSTAPAPAPAQDIAPD